MDNTADLRGFPFTFATESGATGDIEVGPVPNGEVWAITSIDTFFYGDSGGGHLTSQFAPSFATFNLTDPAGGTEEGAGWRGLVVCTHGQGVIMHITHGTFDWVVSGYKYLGV